ncbi:MAG TPA: serine/threonine-protein kinase [Polyangiaceae bacterium]|nr:serine/threonine-protein kinase [Polyangiaceae bacterium]
MVSEGDLLAGKYRVESVLGEGGMGYVVAALHEQLEQRVAVKLLVPELAQDQDAAARFLREARAAVRIQSEHVARVLDVGELEGGAPYMVMEFLSGRDLAHELEARSTFEIGPAIDYVLQACEAVAEAHAIGVIHRDLKPANLFLTRRADGSPLVKVLDFGISKALASSSGPVSASLTAAHTLLGSPAYMSPEQARRPKDVDIRTDIWAFGVILYEFLTGDTPFHGDVPLEVITAALSDPMPSIAAVRSDVPRELEAVVAKCMEKRAEDRYQTIAEFAEALRPFAPSESMRSISRISGIIRSVAPPPPSPETGSTTLRSAGARTPPQAEAAAPALEPVTRKDTPARRETPRRRTPGGSEPTELAHDSIQPQTRAAKDTQTDFGRSQPASHRSRRRVIFVVAGVAATALVVGGLTLRFAADNSTPTATTDTSPRPAPAGQAEAKTNGSVPSSAPPTIDVTPGVAIDTTGPAKTTGSVAPAAAAVAASAVGQAPSNASAASAKVSHPPAAAPRVEPVASVRAVGGAPQPSVAKSVAPKRGVPNGRDTPAPADAEDPLENRH